MTDKIARICWNTENWKKPSGKNGKSKNKDAYELQTGYGHEEWLLDTTKLIDGYHYAYLQAIGQHREKYIGETYNISIYSINNDTKQRWWIGTINNVEVIDEAESKKVFKKYQENGWYQEMLDQLKSVNADIKEFKKNVKSAWFAVIKFMPSDLLLYETPQEFAYNDPAVTSNYYNLKNKISEPILISPKGFQFQSGHNQGASSKVITYEEHNKTIDLVHNNIQSEIYNQLIKQYGKENVGTEINTGLGNRVDLVVKNNNSFIFYEIKTGSSALKCIREAFGQLMEYSNFNNNAEIENLIVVSPNKLNSEVKVYLEKIRIKYSIPIYYQYFDMESKKLSKLE